MQSAVIANIYFFIHTFNMRDLRKAERFEDFGRVENCSFCAVNGVLKDISKTGIKVSYSIPPVIDMDNEYEVTVRLSRGAVSPLSLIVKPARVIESDEGETDVGFSILRSKDTPKLEAYVSRLEEDSVSSEDVPELTAETAGSSLFI